MSDRLGDDARAALTILEKRGCNAAQAATAALWAAAVESTSGGMSRFTFLRVALAMMNHARRAKRRIEVKHREAAKAARAVASSAA